MILKSIAMILAAILGFFSWILDPFIPDRTEFVVDGKYVGFSSKKELMERFLALAEENDTESIYEVFSNTAKNESENLNEKIPELITFLNENMTSWEEDGGVGEGSTVGGFMIRKNYHDYILHTDDTDYSFQINVVDIDTQNENNEGFYTVLIYPDDMGQYCSSLGSYKGGIYIFYPAEEPYEGNIMEQISSFTNAENSDGIYNLFAQTAKDNAPYLEEDIEDFIEFFQGKITSWELQNCMTEKGTLSGENVIRRELLFFIHTPEETYRCNIRDIIEDKENGQNLGVYSISVYPEHMYFEYMTLGYDEPGVFRKNLTIKPSSEDVDGGGIITLKTSEKATVTCDIPYVTLTQKDDYTWEAYLLNGDYRVEFTAAWLYETATCRVWVDESEESDVEKTPVSGKLRFNTNSGNLESEDLVEYNNFTRKTVGSTVDLSPYVPTRKGYHFTGWYADEELTQPVTEIVMEKETTVYAGWEKIK